VLRDHRVETYKAIVRAYQRTDGFDAAGVRRPFLELPTVARARRPLTGTAPVPAT
jgi:hypothetical protein